MRVQRLHEPAGPLVLEEVPEPVPGPDEVLLSVEACGVGLSVLNGMAGQLGRAPTLPLVPGHEIVGRVIDVGSAVRGIDVGARVTVYFHVSCGYCLRCRAGQDPLCLNHGGLVGVHRDGGYADNLTPGRQRLSLMQSPPRYMSVRASAAFGRVRRSPSSVLVAASACTWFRSRRSSARTSPASMSTARSSRRCSR